MPTSRSRAASPQVAQAASTTSVSEELVKRQCPPARSSAASSV